MSSRIAVCETEDINVHGIHFKKTPFTPQCALEEEMNTSACWCEIEGGKLFAVRSPIGKAEHPFPAFCEAARYIDGVWIVGIDEQQNRYFTPLFTR